MKIPQQIRIGKTRYRVEVRKGLGPELFGGISYRHGVIMVSKRHPCTGEPRTPRQMAQTFWHEVTHGILKAMNNPLEADEAFVEGFAKRLNHAIHSAKF